MADTDGRPKTIRGKCDICMNKDGFNNHNLQKCKECGVCVHETCYGLVATEGGRKDPDWMCHACAAVGTDVVVGKKKQGDEEGTEEEDIAVTQEERPTACALCPIKTGLHAMHPLYDVGGKTGRHVVLPPTKKGGPKQLAWVHTLCAMYHSAHSGYVYGCDKDGDWEEDTSTPVNTEPPQKKSKSTPSDDDESIISDSSSDSDDDDGRGGKKAFAGTHRFVIGGKEQTDAFREKDVKWAKQTRKNILEIRKLVCMICKKKDNVHTVLRIPIQCSAGSADENALLKKRRRTPDVSCDRAMHVGCAQWGLNAKGEKAAFRRVYYHPGLQDDGDTFRSKPDVNCYCNKHAKELHEGKQSEKRRAQRRIVEESDED